MKIIIFLSSLFLVSKISAQQPIQVMVNLNTEHLVNKVSEFDRNKFIILHADIDDNEWDNDAQRKQLMSEYDVYFGRNNGSLVWEFNQSVEDKSKSGWPDVKNLKKKGEKSRQMYAKQSDIHGLKELEGRYKNMIYGGQPFPVYPSGQKTRPKKCCSTSEPWAYKNYNAVAEFYAYYLKEFFSSDGKLGKPRPKYIEVLNEPFVKSKKLNTTNENIAIMHKVVAKRVKKLNPDVKVGGYSAAHPAYEKHNFKQWENSWKLFIDTAGKDMDFFSLHLYDFLADSGEELQRKGSNIEAIIDMVEHYSYLKLGKVKPLSISEYGWLGRSLNGPYNKKRDWYNVRSFSSIMMQLMERQDQIISAIPFMILKAKWWDNPENYNYSYRLLRQKNELKREKGEEWVYTEFLKFFQLWSDVNGKRVDTYANDPDVLVDAYVTKNKAYIILSNLEHKAVTTTLNIPEISINKVTKILSKHLYAGRKGIPVLERSTKLNPDNLNKLTIGKEATIILELDFDDEIKQTNKSNEYKKYAQTYLQPITAANEIEFEINEIFLKNDGEAVLRLGIGRAHDLSLSPAIKINGEPITTPNDWKGYDQKNRDQFFGVLEIPVPYKLLDKANKITVTFPDSGGMVSSIALQIFNFDKPLNRKKNY